MCNGAVFHNVGVLLVPIFIVAIVFKTLSSDFSLPGDIPADPPITKFNNSGITWKLFGNYQ